MAFPLRIGIIGAGRRGQRRLETLARLSGVLPAGVLDIDGERAGAAGGAFQVPVVPSANELFDQSDAVVIASTRRDRGLLAEHAVRAGLHVFLEAPATTSVDDAERLLSLAEEANVRIGVGASHRFLPLRSVLPARWRPTLAVYHAA
ncbi:MAG: Gfo/Idh/MocA family oxidoreductase, partial [Bacteroidota bacterium]